MRRGCREIAAHSVDIRRRAWYTVRMKSQLELMKLFSAYDGEVSMSDFTPAELEAALNVEQDKDAAKRKYFDFYNDVKSPSLKKQDW